METDEPSGVGVRGGLLVAAEEPHAEHGDERAGEEKRRDHRKSDSEGERGEEGFRGADHEERGDKNGDDAQHREEAREGGFAGGFEGGAGEGSAAGEVGVDVFHSDRRFVDENADGEREAGERHEVEALAGDPEGERRGEEGDGDIDDDDQRAAPIAQEEEHHEAGEQGAERAFLGQCGDRLVDDG